MWCFFSFETFHTQSLFVKLSLNIIARGPCSRLPKICSSKSEILAQALYLYSQTLTLIIVGGLHFQFHRNSVIPSSPFSHLTVKFQFFPICTELPKIAEVLDYKLNAWLFLIVFDFQKELSFMMNHYLFWFLTHFSYSRILRDKLSQFFYLQNKSFLHHSLQYSLYPFTLLGTKGTQMRKVSSLIVIIRRYIYIVKFGAKSKQHRIRPSTRPIVTQ